MTKEEYTDFLVQIIWREKVMTDEEFSARLEQFLEMAKAMKDEEFSARLVECLGMVKVMTDEELTDRLVQDIGIRRSVWDALDAAVKVAFTDMWVRKRLGGAYAAPENAVLVRAMHDLCARLYVWTA